MEQIKEKVLRLKKELKELKDGKYFWASKVGKDLKKRPVKIHFDFKKELIKEKKVELKGWNDCLAEVSKVIDDLIKKAKSRGIIDSYGGYYSSLRELKKEIGI